MAHLHRVHHPVRSLTMQSQDCALLRRELIDQSLQELRHLFERERMIAKTCRALPHHFIGALVEGAPLAKLTEPRLRLCGELCAKRIPRGQLLRLEMKVDLNAVESPAEPLYRIMCSAVAHMRPALMGWALDLRDHSAWRRSGIPGNLSIRRHSSCQRTREDRGERCLQTRQDRGWAGQAAGVRQRIHLHLELALLKCAARIV